MYPLVRIAVEMARARRLPILGPFEPHVSHHRIRPRDLDPWMELNNGRTLTLYDLGRLPFFLRTGLIGALRREGWGMTVAGSSVRYRRRVVAFQRVTMVTRLIGWDARFLYRDQSMWRGRECTSQVPSGRPAPGRAASCRLPGSWRPSASRRKACPCGLGCRTGQGRRSAPVAPGLRSAAGSRRAGRVTPPPGGAPAHAAAPARTRRSLWAGIGARGPILRAGHAFHTAVISA
jgi:acyl-CoA thioesterase FadM